MLHFYGAKIIQTKPKTKKRRVTTPAPTPVVTPAPTPSPATEEVLPPTPATSTPIDILTQVLPSPATSPQPKR